MYIYKDLAKTLTILYIKCYNMFNSTDDIGGIALLMEKVVMFVYNAKSEAKEENNESVYQN